MPNTVSWLSAKTFMARAFALHIELKRYDNRLTFAHQVQVARHLGYFGEGNRGIEMMMKEFFRTLRRVAELNKMLLKIFDKAILNNGEEAEAVIIDDDFQRRGNMIEARKPALFQARPETILDMFLHMASDSTIESVAPATMRQLRTARRRLNKFLHTLPPHAKSLLSWYATPTHCIKRLAKCTSWAYLLLICPNGTRLLARCSSTCSTSIRWMNIVFVYSNISIYLVTPITTIATLFAVKFTLKFRKRAAHPRGYFP